MLFASVDASIFDPTFNMCLPEEDICYGVRTLPKLGCPNHNIGYNTGYQTLEIPGLGFDADSPVQVTIDNHPCNVKTVTPTLITC